MTIKKSLAFILLPLALLVALLVGNNQAVSAAGQTVSRVQAKKT